MNVNSPYDRRPDKWLNIIILVVALDGLLMIPTTLLEQFTAHHLRLPFHLQQFFSIYRLILGVTLIYLASLLRRLKYIAWLGTLAVYVAMALFALIRLALIGGDRVWYWTIFHDLILPVVIIVALFYYRRTFTVKSDLETFRQSLQLIVVLLAITLVYGVSGFMLMDDHDFHQEIGFTGAVHHTIDQLGLTTHQVTAYTRRGRVFVDSLSSVTIATLVYAALSISRPLKSKLSSHSTELQLMEKLLTMNLANSEDFFKLWPQDKTYFFSSNRDAGLAARVQGGVALVAGDPVGANSSLPQLLKEFETLCHASGWQIAFIHTEPAFLKLYESFGYTPQKIGEEAIVDIAHFQKVVRGSKYFRHIANKFSRYGYSTELLLPPHDKNLLKRLKVISDDWLKQPGRVERGFLMGFFAEKYLDRCPVMVARDKAGHIQAFINQVPSFDPEEANFDLLRHTHDSPGNINDFLLMNFIDYVAQQGFKRTNLGLSPLAGLDKKQPERSLINNILRFAYSNGDKLYSFSGLHRFKSKYEPEWEPRYIMYRGGISGFTQTLNALNKAMRVK